MERIELSSETDFEGWRAAARRLCAQSVPPEAVEWAVPGAAQGLFGGLGQDQVTRTERKVSVPKRFVDFSRKAICHRDPERFARAYRLLWRLQETPSLLSSAVDGDVLWLHACVKAIRRDIHKTHAFVRFRKVDETDGRERFAAWFEPEHRSLELSAPFFTRRFPNMDWAILTPDASAIWEGESLRFAGGAKREDAPADDCVETQWRTYYKAIFNPARLKVSAMTSEMPKKYWRNLPEADLIPDLIATAQSQQNAMTASAPSEPNPLAGKVSARLAPRAAPPPDFDTLAGARQAIEGCTRCPLHCNATQAVFGEGPERARLMIVGEQPGDQEDLAGRPFVGPAGQLFDRAMEEAGVERGQAYVTNAVKHFKHEQRGKRRIHSKPNAGEIDHCRWWLDFERDTVRPDLIVALGASAARGVFGRTLKIGENRGRLMEAGPSQALITVHPSYLLRLPDADAKRREYAKFVEDLAQARDWLEARDAA